MMFMMMSFGVLFIQWSMNSILNKKKCYQLDNDNHSEYSRNKTIVLRLLLGILCLHTVVVCY